ncbi:hypothetical protein DFQ27_003392 [Actinomortierella ambigua]|uniref:Uncharacterized protein n=1 Tax=Actinomortierella ambigua TaxID=1343610 RepID=A0A9P6UCS8_9FUNG|nr:hypothetical protein DFQ27_003392 [Actinomortierella ambigua]
MPKRSSPTDKDAQASAEYELAAKIIGGGKPNSVECAGAAYLLSLKDGDDVSGEHFFTFIRNRHPWARSKRIVSAWAVLKAHGSQIEGRTEPQDFEEPAGEAAKAKRSRPTANDDSEDDNRTISGSSSGNSGSSGSSGSSGISGSIGSSGSSTLTVRRLKRMKDEYHKNFDDYSGLSWVLPSLINVDAVIHSHVQSLKKESPLHSFIISNVRSVTDLFSSEDKAIVAQELTRKRDGDPTTDAEAAFVSLYLSTPHNTQTALSHGWQLSSDSTLDSTTKMSLYHAMMQIYMAYQQDNMKLSTSQSESWYAITLWALLPTILRMGGRLDHQPGEVVSEASALRKNVDRDLEGRRMHGRKLDGVISCSVTGLELGAIEAAKVDVGAQGTKSLSDSRKLAKAMKDMHDRVVAKSRDDIRDKLKTFGLLLSRNKMTVYILRRLPGRHYQLVDDGSYTFPITWDARGLGARAIADLLVRLVLLKKEMEEMADRVVEWTQPGAGGFEKEVLVRTLTTPLPSPKSERSS